MVLNYGEPSLVTQVHKVAVDVRVLSAAEAGWLNISTRLAGHSGPRVSPHPGRKPLNRQW